jgi:hypothetical protein
MKRRLTRILSKKKFFEIELKFKKILTPDISEKINFVDLAIRWKRGTQQTNETKGYEVNYLECDMEMDDVFRRVSGFYGKGKDF